MTRTLWLSLLLAASAAAQPSSRVAVGVGSGGLGDAGAAFESLVAGFAQVAPGLSAQRAYPVWWLAEAGARLPVRGLELGGRVQGRWAQADALYGDYAGTVDVVGRTAALVIEGEVATRLGDGPARLALHSGVVALSTELTADATASVDGRSATAAYRLTGTGTGMTVGASLLVDAPLGPATVSARLGARWGRVASLRAQEVTDTGQTNGELPLAHDLTGVTLTVGVGL